MKKIPQVIIYLSILFSLFGCASPHFNTPSIPCRFAQPMCSRVNCMVVEPKGVLGISTSPTLIESGATGCRVLGFVPRGTVMQIITYRVPSLLAETYDCDTLITICIKSGAFANQTFDIDPILFKKIFGIQTVYRRGSSWMDTCF